MLKKCHNATRHLSSKEVQYRKAVSFSFKGSITTFENELSKFHSLEPRDQKLIAQKFSELLENDFERGKNIFEKFFQLFDKNPNLEECKEVFQEKYEGNYEVFKKNALNTHLPFENEIKNFLEFEPSKQRKIARNIEDLLEGNFEKGKKLYLKYQDLFQSNEKLSECKSIFEEKYYEKNDSLQSRS